MKLTSAQIGRLMTKMDGPRFDALVRALVEPYRRLASRTARLQGATIDPEWVAPRVRAVLLQQLHGPGTPWSEVARRHGIKKVSSGAVARFHGELEGLLSFEVEGIWPRYARQPVRDVRGCLAYIDGTAATRDAAVRRRRTERADQWKKGRRNVPTTDDASRALRALAQFATDARQRLAEKERAQIAEQLQRGDSLNKIAKDLHRSYAYVDRRARPGAPSAQIQVVWVMWQPVTARLCASLPGVDFPTVDPPTVPMVWHFVAALVRRHYVSKEAVADALGTSARSVDRLFVSSPWLEDQFEKRPSQPKPARQQPVPSRRTPRGAPNTVTDENRRINLQWTRPYGVPVALANLWEHSGISAKEGGPWAREGFLPEHYRWLEKHFPGTGPAAARRSIDRGFMLPTGKKVMIRGLLTEEHKAVVLPDELPPLWSR